MKALFSDQKPLCGSQPFRTRGTEAASPGLSRSGLILLRGGLRQLGLPIFLLAWEHSHRFSFLLAKYPTFFLFFFFFGRK